LIPNAPSVRPLTSSAPSGRCSSCALTGISPRTLSLRLRELEQEGIVERQQLPELPPRVEYALTDKGRALLPMIEDMRCFGERWLEGAADPALVAPGA